MATRYYVNGDTLYISELPEEHAAARKAGFEAFSAWYALQFADHYAKNGKANYYLPAGFTLEHMRQVTEFGKAGHFGTYRVGRAGRLEHVGERFAKVGRGRWELQPAA